MQLAVSFGWAHLTHAIMHAILEFLPLAAGALAGIVDHLSHTAQRWHLSTRVIAVLVIGALCSFLAGELGHGLAEAVGCIMFDGLLVASSWLAARFIMKRFTISTR